jgi:MFS transporter, DHA1 family, inner membrane transport protein
MESQLVHHRRAPLALYALTARAFGIGTTEFVIMFTGLTVATLLGVPAGAWIGFTMGWRAAFWAVTLIGVLATLIIALAVPSERTRSTAVSLREELRVIARPSVLLGLLMTALGFAGLFTVFTYIAPILTRIAGFAEGSVSPILLVFGVGFIVGNLVGGRLADRNLVRTLLGTLIFLALVLGCMTFALHDKTAAIVFTGLLGAAAFATVAPLQLWVLQRAGSAGQSLASSLNIGAFNLGNALGAWLGGLVIERGPGMVALPGTAALVAACGLIVALWCVRLERNRSDAGCDDPTLATD